MRVALFASAFHPHVGGVEELVRQLAHAYLARGVSVIVITNRWPPELPAFEEFEGIPVYRLPMRIPEGSWKVQLKYHLTHRANISELVSILKKHAIDTLHVQCVAGNGYYALIAKKALKLPLVVTTQGERTMDATQLFQRSPFMRELLKELLRAADYITACSRDTLEDVERFYGEPFRARAKVIYNGIRLSDFQDGEAFPYPRPYILGIGRHVAQKGFDVLIEAFGMVRQSTHDLLIAGDGPEQEALIVLAKRQPNASQILFPGRADRPTAVSLFKGCSFFVLPSRMEPQGIVNLEAMAAGKAVIASRVGGVPEIVLDGETGVLVPPENACLLSQEIVRLTGNAELREQLGSAGLQRAQIFDWAVLAAEYLAIYRQISL